MATKYFVTFFTTGPCVCKSKKKLTLNFGEVSYPGLCIFFLSLVRISVLQLEHGIVDQSVGGFFEVGNHLSVLRRVPAPLLATRAGHYLVVEVFRIGPDHIVIVAHRALHPKLVYWRSVVHAFFRLLRIVTDSCKVNKFEMLTTYIVRPLPLASSFALTHADVLSAALAPNVVGHLEANDEDAEVQLVGALPERVRALPCVQ